MGVKASIIARGVILVGRRGAFLIRRQFLGLLIILERITILRLCLLRLVTSAPHGFVFLFLVGVREAAVGLGVMV